MIALLALGSALAADLGGTFVADGLAPALDGELFATDTGALPDRYDARLSSVLAYHSLVAYTASGVEPVVGASLTAHASAVWRLGPARLGVSLPGAALLSAEGLDRPRAVAGDPELQVKVSPWAAGEVRAALVAGASIPLGGEGWWVGAGGPTGAASLVLDAHPGPWTFALNLGIAGQEPEDLFLDGAAGGSQLGAQWEGRLGLGYCTQWTCISIEALGGTGVTSPADAQSTPLEALVAVKQSRPDGRSWRAGGGLGVLPGVGAPAMRLFVGVGHAPVTPSEVGAP